MKLKDILAIQSIVEGRATPYDLLESGYTYYSKSKDEYIDLLDLHITHFIRIFLNLVEENNTTTTALDEAVAELFKKSKNKEEIKKLLERIQNEKKNKRIFNYWWVYDDTDTLCNTTNIILEM